MLPFASPSKGLRSAPPFLFLLLALILVCSRAARADSFPTGQYVFYGQEEWGDVPNGTNAASLLQNNYGSVYASVSGVFVVGIPVSDPGNSIEFTGSNTLLSYLPDGGAIGVFDSDLVDPTTTSAGAFAGALAALKLNIDFSDAGLLTSHFGDLYLTDFDPSLSQLNGLTLRQLENDANITVSGGTSIYDDATLFEIVESVDAAFDEGHPSSFADDHLTVTNPNGGGNPTPTPEPSSLLLLASGLLALGMLRHRQRRHASVIPS